jgi:hypothetical protein
MADAMDLTHKDLALDLLEIAIEEIRNNIDAGLDCDGRAFRSLEPRYKAWKDKEYPGRPIGILTGFMTSDEQMRGERHITPHSAVMTYGTVLEARDQAGYFQESENEKGDITPNRPFYGLTKQAIKRMDDRVDKAFS